MSRPEAGPAKYTIPRDGILGQGDTRRIRRSTRERMDSGRLVGSRLRPKAARSAAPPYSPLGLQAPKPPQAAFVRTGGGSHDPHALPGPPGDRGGRPWPAGAPGGPPPPGGVPLLPAGGPDPDPLPGRAGSGPGTALSPGMDHRVPGGSQRQVNQHRMGAGLPLHDEPRALQGPHQGLSIQVAGQFGAQAVIATSSTRVPSCGAGRPLALRDSRYSRMAPRGVLQDLFPGGRVRDHGHPVRGRGLDAGVP